MKEDHLEVEAGKIKSAAPIYLGIQLAILVLTYLETPVYMEAYRGGHQTFTLTGWVGAWFALVIFGLSLGVFILVARGLHHSWPAPERVRLSLAYLAGALAGMLTLGLRFMEIMPANYFIFIGGAAGFGILAYALWIIWRKRHDEIFA